MTERCQCCGCREDAVASYSMLGSDGVPACALHLLWVWNTAASVGCRLAVTPFEQVEPSQVREERG